jgi:hypothetical protein
VEHVAAVAECDAEAVFSIGRRICLEKESMWELLPKSIKQLHLIEATSEPGIR